MFDCPTLRPAYGRDYPTAKDCVDAFIEGKDFQLAATGQYTSSREMPRYDVYMATLRYNRLTEAVVVEYTDGNWKVQGESNV